MGEEGGEDTRWEGGGFRERRSESTEDILRKEATTDQQPAENRNVCSASHLRVGWTCWAAPQNMIALGVEAEGERRRDLDHSHKSHSQQ